MQALHSPAGKSHRAGEQAPECHNTPRLALMVLISLSIPLTQEVATIAQTSSSQLEIHLGKDPALLGRPPGFSNSVKGIEIEESPCRQSLYEISRRAARPPKHLGCFDSRTVSGKTKGLLYTSLRAPVLRVWKVWCKSENTPRPRILFSLHGYMGCAFEPQVPLK